MCRAGIGLCRTGIGLCGATIGLRRPAVGQRIATIGQRRATIGQRRATIGQRRAPIGQRRTTIGRLRIVGSPIHAHGLAGGVVPLHSNAVDVGVDIFAGDQQVSLSGVGVDVCLHRRHVGGVGGDAGRAAQLLVDVADQLASARVAQARGIADLARAANGENLQRERIGASHLGLERVDEDRQLRTRRQIVEIDPCISRHASSRVADGLIVGNRTLGADVHA